LRALRGSRPQFSEADLVHEYFLARKEPGVMVDVGAHYGESFLPYLARGWIVRAFEPDARNRAVLMRNVGSGDFKVFDCAVSDRDAEGAAFFASDESDGISSLTAFRKSHHEVGRVAVRTLAGVLAAEGMDRVDFLKIDTEGHDLLVLRGFPWDRMTPEVVLCEFEDRKTVPLGYDHRNLGDFLLQHGFRVFLSEWAPIVRYGGNHTWCRWHPYPCELADSGAWGNFVAFRPNVSLAAVERYLSRFSSN